VWEDRELVGGVYGLAIGGCFFAESMFHRRTDASKVALWAMVEKCRELGFVLFDAQIMNPHLESLGAYEVPHDEYMVLMKRAIAVDTEWSPPVQT
jgi:leucyl/phenylalanyl-tRNA--protein transferase